MRDYLLHGVKNGFRIADAATGVKSYELKNYKSVDSDVFIDKLITNELCLAVRVWICSLYW